MIEEDNIESVVVDDFDILVKNNEVAISYISDGSKITSATLAYDGRNCMILKRNNKKILLFTQIPQISRDDIARVNDIIFIETNDKNEVLDCYEVPITWVDEIPFPDDYEKTINGILDEAKIKMGDENFEKLMTELEKLSIELYGKN